MLLFFLCYCYLFVTNNRGDTFPTGGLQPMTIPMLADPNHQMSRDYGVLVEEDGFNLRGLFIIDDKGILRQITINDRPVGRCVDETLRLVQAFQFTDKHGEVCPAGWKPGSATIKPDPEDKKQYFTSANWLAKPSPISPTSDSTNEPFNRKSRLCSFL